MSPQEVLMRPLAIICAAALAACTLPEPHATSTGPSADAAAAWLAAYTTALNAGDLDATMALYAPDAMSMPPDGPAVSGADALRDWYAPAFTEYTMELTATVDDVVVAADLAVLRAKYDQRLVPKDGGEPATQLGSWLIVLRATDDGSWKLWRDMWSAVQPGEPPAA
jgi:uncharacterized protein (TIGR02246 family)